MVRRIACLVSLIALFSLTIGCSSSPSADGASASASLTSATAKSVTLPAGTTITVRLGKTLGSEASSAGETFTASLAKPVQVDGTEVLPAGAEAAGRVLEAVPQGRFKGAAVLRFTLTSLTVNGDELDVKTTPVSRSIKGKGKRTAALVGGGAGAGALIGGLAGGGKGALIGAAAGAGAGTAGAAYTGNKEIVLPAESTVSFKLSQPLEIKQ